MGITRDEGQDEQDKVISEELSARARNPVHFHPVKNLEMVAMSTFLLNSRRRAKARDKRMGASPPRATAWFRLWTGCTKILAKIGPALILQAGEHCCGNP
jgi:hypothetical protein